MSLLPHGRQSGMFIRAPVTRVSRCLLYWGNEETGNRFTTGESKRLTLQQAWEYLAERKFNPDRAVLVPLGDWTAFVDNHPYEFLAAAELHVLCDRLRVDTCFFRFDDAPGTEHRGSAQFNYSRYVEGGEFPVKERQVMLLNEGGWKFQPSGDPLPFERLDLYALPKKRDRLTPDVLRAYGEALGIPFWDPAAYGQDVVLLRWGEKPATPAGAAAALKKVMSIFGRPSLIMDRHGRRPPPP